MPGEQAERAAIFREHVGAELINAALLSRTKDLLEEERAEAESLPAVRHNETDVGCPYVGRAVPRRADQLGLLRVVDFGDERHSPAIVAEVDDGREPELVGVSRYGPSDVGTADIGLVVADAWQGLGLGSLLLEQILHAGEQRGIHEFSAEVLTDNRRALSLLARHTTITRRTVGNGVTSVVLTRRADAPVEATRQGGS